jgi:hypothetical protein
MMEAVRTSETSVENHFTRQYIPEDNSEHHTRRRENLKSHLYNLVTEKRLKVNCYSMSAGPRHKKVKYFGQNATITAVDMIYTFHS